MPPGPSAAARAQEGWWPCAVEQVLVECTWLEVPLDHADPASANVRLLARRIRALDPARRIGVLVTIAGGPGQRGTFGVRLGAHTKAVHERFDIVSWDPRGTSGETRIRCIPTWDPFGSLDRTPDTPTERRALDQRTVRLAARCRQRHGPILPHVGTLHAANDLEWLRKALGEQQVTILASSYGSQVGLLYATLFPGHVRAMVLDGYSDPNRSPGHREVEQAAAFERALDRLLTACAENVDCPFRGEGTPGAALDELLEQLDVAPIPAGADGHASLSQSDAYEAIAGSLLAGPRSRERLLEALASAAAGDGGQLLEIADALRHAFEDSGLDRGTFMAIYCADTGSYWERLTDAEVTELAERVRRVAPRLGAWLWSPPARDDLPPVGLCAMQDAAPPAWPRPVDAAGSGPVLVLSTTGDPTTPIDGAMRALEDLEDAVVVAVDADHHLAYHTAIGRREWPRAGCVVELVERFLVRLERPARRACAVGAGREMEAGGVDGLPFTGMVQGRGSSHAMTAAAVRSAGR